MDEAFTHASPHVDVPLQHKHVIHRSTVSSVSVDRAFGWEKVVISQYKTNVHPPPSSSIVSTP